MAISEQELLKKSTPWTEDIEQGLKDGEVPIPVSPVLRAITINRPTYKKSLKWCSCGLSDK